MVRFTMQCKIGKLWICVILWRKEKLSFTLTWSIFSVFILEQGKGVEEESSPFPEFSQRLETHFLKTFEKWIWQVMWDPSLQLHTTRGQCQTRNLTRSRRVKWPDIVLRVLGGLGSLLQSVQRAVGSCSGALLEDLIWHLRTCLFIPSFYSQPDFLPAQAK